MRLLLVLSLQKPEAATLFATCAIVKSFLPAEEMHSPKASQAIFQDFPWYLL